MTKRERGLIDLQRDYQSGCIPEKLYLRERRRILYGDMFQPGDVVTVNGDHNYVISHIDGFDMWVCELRADGTRYAEQHVRSDVVKFKLVRKGE